MYLLMVGIVFVFNIIVTMAVEFAEIHKTRAVEEEDFEKIGNKVADRFSGLFLAAVIWPFWLIFLVVIFLAYGAFLNYKNKNDNK